MFPRSTCGLALTFGVATLVVCDLVVRGEPARGEDSLMAKARDGRHDFDRDWLDHLG